MGGETGGNLACASARVSRMWVGLAGGRWAVGVPDRGLDVRRRAGGLCALPAGSRRGRRPGSPRRRRRRLLLSPHAVPPRTRPLSRGLPARASRGSGAGRRSPSPRPPPAVQVPSAFRRGGLKTPGGSPVRPWVVGGGPAGELCGEGPGSSLGSSADSAPPPRPGSPPHARHRRVRGGRRAVARAPRVPRVPRRVGWGVGTPGRLWGVRARPRGGGGVRGVPAVKPSDPSLSLVSFAVFAGRPEATPPGGVPCQEGASPCRGGGNPRQMELVRLLAVDHSARASMKNAASCEN